MEKESRIFVAGSRGLVGSAIVRNLQKKGFHNLVLKSRKELDLLDQQEVNAFFAANKIDYVFHAAGKVGGIHANSTQQADFLYENLMIACNVLHASAEYGVKKLLYLGSSCIYPKLAPQPIQEASLLAGPLEKTNEGYAVAKIAGLKLCEMYARQYGKYFISVMPTNLYGPGDNFHPENSHVIPGMMRRFHEAKVRGDSEVVIWGSGSPKREFLFVDDLANALGIIFEKYNDVTPINLGSGEEFKISELAVIMKEITEYPGKIVFDISKPDGTPRKVLDSSRVMELGWSKQTPLRDGLTATYQWALKMRSFERPEVLLEKRQAGLSPHLNTLS